MIATGADLPRIKLPFKNAVRFIILMKSIIFIMCASAIFCEENCFTYEEKGVYFGVVLPGSKLCLVSVELITNKDKKIENSSLIVKFNDLQETIQFDKIPDCPTGTYYSKTFEIKKTDLITENSPSIYRISQRLKRTQLKQSKTNSRVAQKLNSLIVTSLKPCQGLMKTKKFA